MKHHVTCHSMSDTTEFKISDVQDVILKDKFLMLTFDIKNIQKASNLITFFEEGVYLFNFIFLEGSSKIDSFIGSYSKCVLIEDNIFLFFRKES